MVVVNNVSSYMDENKKNIIRNSQYSFRQVLEVSAYLIESGKFDKLYIEMQVNDLQKEVKEMK